MVLKSLEEAKKEWTEISKGKCQFIENEQVNKLTILYRTENIGKNAYVVCKCECSNYKKIRLSHIRKNLINLYYNTFYKKNKDYLKKLCNSFLIILYYRGKVSLILQNKIAFVIKR